MKKIFAAVLTAMVSLPSLLMAQDEGTYIDNLSTQDSSYMDPDLMAASEASGGGNLMVYIIVGVVVVAVVAFFLLKKKKK